MAQFLPPEHVRQVNKLEWPNEIMRATEDGKSKSHEIRESYVIHIYITSLYMECLCRLTTYIVRKIATPNRNYYFQ